MRGPVCDLQSIHLRSGSFSMVDRALDVATVVAPDVLRQNDAAYSKRRFTLHRHHYHDCQGLSLEFSGSTTCVPVARHPYLTGACHLRIPRCLALPAVTRFAHFHFTGPLDDAWTRC